MIHEFLEWTVVAVDGVGVVVMLLGFVISLFRFVVVVWKQRSAVVIREIQMIRCHLGTYLVFALELMIVSDLIHSVMSHELEDLYFLGALVLLRTIIAFFLNREIQELSEAHA